MLFSNKQPLPYGVPMGLRPTELNADAMGRPFGTRDLLGAFGGAVAQLLMTL